MNQDLLRQHILSPLENVIQQELTNIIYYDMNEADNFITDTNGTDIISHQLELQFANSNSLYISWATIDGWHQYSLAISNAPLNTYSNQFSPAKSVLKAYQGKHFTHFDLYGYKINEITTTYESGEVELDKYYNEPHMIVLNFGQISFGVANFYASMDFVPRLPMGDDVWIIFNQKSIDLCIKKLGLEKIEA